MRQLSTIALTPTSRTGIPDGGYAETLAAYHDGLLTDRLVAADCAIYLGHTDEARAILDREPPSEIADLLLAECDFAEGRYGDAADGFARHRSSRGVLGLARVAYMLGHWADCRTYAEAVETMPGASLVHVCRSRVLLATRACETGDVRGALEMFAPAIEGLRVAEGGRYLAYGENGAAWALASEGRMAEARERLEMARRVVESLGHLDDLLRCDSALAQLAYAEGDMESAERLAEHVAAFARERGNGCVEGYACQLMCQIRLAAGRVDDAADAVSSLPFISLVECDWSQLMTRLLVARVRAYRGDRVGADEFPRIIAAVDRLEGNWKGALARLWYWDALAVARPALADLLADDLRRPALASRYWLVAAELRALAAAPRVWGRRSDGWTFRPGALTSIPLSLVDAQAQEIAVYEALDASAQDHARAAAALRCATSTITKTRTRAGLPKPRRGPRRRT
jgi:tetratricopeptide (TPR) repeat protein